MNTNEQQEIRNYCAFLLQKYGIFISPDDPVIPALYVIYKHMNTVDESNQTLCAQIQYALVKIKPREFHFHHPGESWKFQMGVSFRWVLCGLLILALTGIGVWYRSTLDDVNDAKRILRSFGNLDILFHRVNKARDGTFFIDFIAASGDSIRHFIEYERIDKKTIRVYLGKESGNVKK